MQKNSTIQRINIRYKEDDPHERIHHPGCGSVGALLGMHVFRHKTRHWYFRWGIPAIFLLQLAACGAVWYLGR